ncbi:MAG: type IV secretion system DNA-binding domain-containing protein [Candidatus Peribacteraceae bacterium]|nr:type IV secretion system DNA-binding domain-containing protein [Candidatus Peribacteraceae bacterium]
MPLIWIGTILIGWISKPDLWVSLWNWFMADPLEASLLIFNIWFGWWIFKRLFRYWYAVRRSRKLVKFRVLLPRNDSKVDQEKRTEKDFKEKVAVMEQLYRALWEVRSLNVWQVLHYWIFRYRIISFELYAHKGLIIFYVVTEQQLQSIVEKQITSFYPDAEIVPEETPDIWPKGYKLVAYNMAFKKRYMYPLRFYEQMQDDPLNGIANVMGKLHEDETAAIQIVISPSFSNKWGEKTRRFASARFKGGRDSFLSHIPLIKLISPLFDYFFFGGSGSIGAGGSNAPGASGGDKFVRMIQPEEELYKRMGEKAGMSFYHTSVRIFAASKTWNRALETSNNMQVAFNAFKDVYGNYFENRRLFVEIFPLHWNAKLMYLLWKQRFNWPFKKKDLMVEKELAGLYHFPDSRYNKIPSIQWMTYKALPPPPDTPAQGILLGNNVYRGATMPIRFLETDRTRHQYIIGKSGTGKSALLSYMARQDVANGDGVCMVDPHGDLIEDVLAHVPKERAKDIVVFDPSDIGRPMGLNLLEASTPEEKDRASLDAMEIFIKMFGNEIFGPRIQHYFRNGCLTLMDDEDEGATLIDVPRLFVDDEFQRYKVAKCKNAVVRSFWEYEIAKTGAREKEEMIPYFSSKFGPFITNTTMRNIIGQPKSAFNIREIMDSKKVLLVNLSKGKIGDTNAQLLGLIFVNKVNMAALSRASVPRDQRSRFYLYVDEFQNFVTDAFATILSEARKYELALIMAHQYIGQLVGKTEAYGESNTKMRDAVFGNVGTIMSFKIGAEDAEYMAKEFAPVLSEQDVIGIPNFNCYCKLNINNVQSRPFSMATIWDESNRNEKLAELIKEYSRMKYGRKRVFVNQEIEDRIGIIR